MSCRFRSGPTIIRFWWVMGMDIIGIPIGTGGCINDSRAQGIEFHAPRSPSYKSYIFRRSDRVTRHGSVFQRPKI